MSSYSDEIASGVPSSGVSAIARVSLLSPGLSRPRKRINRFIEFFALVAGPDDPVAALIDRPPPHDFGRHGALATTAASPVRRNVNRRRRFCEGN